MVEVEEIYRGSKLPVTIGGAVKVGDHLYGTTSKLLLCLEFLTGELMWEDRAIGAGALVYADGHIYIHGETGDLALVEATPEEYREKGRFTPVDQPERGRARAWTYPVIAQGRLYLHDLGTIWCYDIQASTASTR
jgi:outer membrane protein assembly factor BamB